VHLDALPPTARSRSVVSDLSLSDVQISRTISSTREYTLLKGSWRGQEVVVKRLNAGAGKLNSFELEIEMLRRLEHPHIVQLLAFGRTPYFLVYESIHSTVAQLLNATTLPFPSYTGKDNPSLRQRKRLAARANTKAAASPPLDSLTIAVQLASVMTYLHETFHPGVRIILNSLSSDTVGVLGDGSIKLIGLGECVLVRRAVSEDAVFKLRLDVGDWRFRSPEQLLGWHYNQKTDIFSFAVLAFQMITGKHPSKASSRITPEQYLSDLVNLQARPVLPMKYLPQLVRLLAHCWNADIIARPNFVDIGNSLRDLSPSLVKNYSTLW
jgi:serine/threonine protein kinase